MFYNYVAAARAKQIPENKETGFYVIRVLQKGIPAIDAHVKGKPLPEQAQILYEYTWDGEEWQATIHNSELQRQQEMIAHAAQYIDVEALFAIDWGQITPYTPPINLPYEICALLSPEAHLRSNSYKEVGDHMVDWDGYLYPAGRLALPFVLQLLKYPSLFELARVIEFILVPVAEAVTYYPATKPDWDNVPIHPGPDAEQPLAERLAEAREAYMLLQEHVPFFLTWLKDEDSIVRIQAGKLVACFPDCVEIVAPALQQSFENEPDERAQATFVYNLFDVTTKDRTAYYPWFETLSTEHPDELIRVVATILLAQDRAYPFSEDKVTKIIDWFYHAPLVLQESYHNIYPAHNHGSNLKNDCLKALCFCLPRFPALIFPVILRFLEEVQEPGSSYWIPVKALLEYFFPVGQDLPAVLSSEQREILSILLKLDGEVEKYPWKNLLEEHNLPFSQQELAVLLADQSGDNDTST